MRVEPSVIISSALAVVSVAGMVGLFWQPFAVALNEDLNAGDLAAGLLIPWNTSIYEFPTGGWLFLILTIYLFGFAAWVFGQFADYLRNSRVRISVLDTHVRVVINDKHGESVTYTREQTFHANRRKIRAYRMGMCADHPTGSLNRDSIHIMSHIDDEMISIEPLKRGPSNNMMILDRFKRELPISYLASYMPNTWVSWLYNQKWLFHKKVVFRTAKMEYINECCGENCVMSLSGENNPITAAEFRIVFKKEYQPKDGTVRAYLYHQNACDDVAVHKLQQGDKKFSGEADQVEFYVRKPGIRNASLAVMWTNAYPLEDDTGKRLDAAEDAPENLKRPQQEPAE